MTSWVLALGAALMAAAAPAWALRSPVEGKWIARNLGTPDNRTDAGLEILRDGAGGLIARLTVEITNTYDALMGPVDPVGERKWIIRSEKNELTLEDEDTLAVTGFGEDPVKMRRTDSLPARPAFPAPPPGPEPRWRLRLGSAIFAPAAVADGVAYVGNTDGILFAIRVANGSVAWTFPAGRPIFGEALATSDAVFFASDNGWLYRLDRSNGREVWRYDLGDARESRIPPNPYVYDYDQESPMPVLAEGVLFIGSADGGFHAVDAASGRRRWRIQSNAKIRTTAAVHGAEVIFATMDGWVCAVERASGAEAWSFKKATPYTSGPAVSGDVVVVGNRGSRLRGLDAATGRVLWTKDYWGSWIESTPVFRDGRGYIGSGDLFRVSCFEPATGKNLWRTFVDGWVLERPAVTERMVLVGVSGGRRRGESGVHQSSALTALDRETGGILWSWTMPEWPGNFLSGFVAAPLVSDGVVLVGGVDGTLYAFPAESRARN